MLEKYLETFIEVVGSRFNCTYFKWAEVGSHARFIGLRDDG